MTGTLLWGGCSGGDGGSDSGGWVDGRGADSRDGDGRVGDDEGPVSWSVATDVAAARRGEYRQVLTSGTATRTAPAIEEWVTYDLDVPFVDRRIVWRIDTTTGQAIEGVSRENPTLRAVTTGTATYVSSSLVEERCGTTWTEVTPDLASAMTGAPVDSFRADPVLEPIEILRTAGLDAPPGDPADAGTYRIEVPGETGLQWTSRTLWEQPGVIERVAALSPPAEVRLPRDGGPVEITVDLAEAMAALNRPLTAPQTATTTWQITAPIDAIDTTAPTGAAALGSCDLTSLGG
jgi:hypothetical protein